MKIYFPMSARVLTVGHIRCIDMLTRKGDLVVGLLTKKAMKGYKEEIVPYEDREFILNHLYVFDDFTVVPQDSLDPSANLKKYKCTHMASGDGWEPSELAAMKKLGVTPLDIDSKYPLHSSGILGACKSQTS